MKQTGPPNTPEHESLHLRSRAALCNLAISLFSSPFAKSLHFAVLHFHLFSFLKSYVSHFLSLVFELQCVHGRDTEKLVRQLQDEQQARTVALETWMSKLSKPRNDKRGSVAELEEEKNRWASWALVSAELQQRLDKVEKRSSEVK